MVMESRVIFPGIVGYTGLIDNPMRFVEMVDKASAALGQEVWYEAGSAPKGDSKAKTNHEHRRGLNFGIFPGIQDELPKEFGALWQISEEMSEGIKPAMEDYSRRYGAVDLTDYFGWVMLKYREGDFFVAHTDASKEYPRQVSLVYYVNNDYEGGDLYFPFLDVKIKPLAGELVLFPSDYLFAHEATKVTSGVKYALINFVY